MLSGHEMRGLAGSRRGGVRWLVGGKAKAQGIGKDRCLPSPPCFLEFIYLLMFPVSMEIVARKYLFCLHIYISTDCICFLLSKTHLIFTYFTSQRLPTYMGLIIVAIRAKICCVNQRFGRNSNHNLPNSWDRAERKGFTDVFVSRFCAKFKLHSLIFERDHNSKIICTYLLQILVMIQMQISRNPGIHDWPSHTSALQHTAT